MVMCFIFKQKTAYEMRISDWSSDVCSSDLWGGSGGSNEATAPVRGGHDHRRLCRLFSFLEVGHLVQEDNGALGVGGGLHDGASVVLQHLYPARDVAGVIGARLDR